METSELHKILDDETKRLTISELKQVVYELKNDCLKESTKWIDEFDKWNEKLSIHYTSEANAFQICLDLLEHLESKE